MNISAPIIECSGIIRDFKKVRAVDGLSLSVNQGELFGLVGPDGAGKTTTLRILAGLLSFDEGISSILGLDLREKSEEIKSHIGYMAQQFSLYGELSVEENLLFFAELFDVPSTELASRMERLLKFAGLTEFKKRRAVHLSGGMQKKLALACTLIHEPKILLLDEPTTGVDPISRREFWNILTELILQGTTIVVSTPYMDEADRCARVGLMFAGRLVVCDSPKNIKATFEGKIIEIRTVSWQKAFKVVSKIPGINEVYTYGNTIHALSTKASQLLPEIEQALKREQIRFAGIRLTPPRMEEAFISLIRKLES